MLLTERFSLIIVGLALGAQLGKRSFLDKYLKTIWRLSIVSFILISVYWSWQQYVVWENSELTKAFLPPYTNITYYLQTITRQIYAPWLIALAASLFVAWLAGVLNRRYDERFFEEEEIGLMRLGIFLSGYPGFFFYIPLVLLSAVIGSLYYTLRKGERMPLYYLWLPLAIFAIILKNYWIPTSILSKLNL